MPYALGGPMAAFALVWHFCAAERPDEPDASGKAPADAARAADAPGTARPVVKEKAMEWGVFSVPAIRGAMSCHVAANNMGYCFLQWSPTYYNEVCRVNVCAWLYLVSMEIPV